MHPVKFTVISMAAFNIFEKMTKFFPVSFMPPLKSNKIRQALFSFIHINLLPLLRDFLLLYTQKGRRQIAWPFGKPSLPALPPGS
jgi:hypothetical protein